MKTDVPRKAFVPPEENVAIVHSARHEPQSRLSGPKSRDHTVATTEE